ncbi:MAG: AAA family ATPase [Gammaproteobacteria bacterium]|nr:AAA family ATPase [Gammaproteobacteria bacterium]
MQAIDFNRILQLPTDYSAILLGPRGVGKSTLLKKQFAAGAGIWINLLLAAEEERYLRNPDSLLAEVAALPADLPYVVIDEIQKVPKLLDIVHQLIESTNKVFILSGSSARKLKKGASNLLAGRAFIFNLAAFTFEELQDSFDLQTALTWGMLPSIYQFRTDLQRTQYLKTYAHTYLKEEVWAEQFIRQLSPFRYFLEVVAQCNGKIINFSKIARDVGIDYKTVENYYSILEDTLLGFFLPAYDGSLRKQISKASKFYLFDTGVSRALARMLSVPVRERTAYYGELFEQFIICEIKKYINYYHDEYRLTYLCTKNDTEIDLIVQRPAQETLLIEIKSSSDVQPDQLKALTNLKDEIPNSIALCISNDKNKKRYGEIKVWPWREAILHYFKN